MSVRITEDDFDIALEHEKLKSRDAGAIVTFTGTVRDLPNGGGLNAMTLEHYPGMTESEIEMIIDQAKSRWPLAKITVIHRVGRMLPTENIVFVGCSSAHRDAAFDGANLSRYIVVFPFQNDIERYRNARHFRHIWMYQMMQKGWP